ncbi:Limbic system-associated membrane protein [Stylophora pistillata]|uniref:Limbic system-associated membrane protein n=1 Tax=Stylophora pistillata TaxID=50429 RepID=A0A2B4SPM5_STYPI|nr:Limbic system-associated membrane protein [Stylophora pistillata]
MKANSIAPSRSGFFLHRNHQLTKSVIFPTEITNQRTVLAEPPKISLSSVQGSYREGAFVNVNCTASGIPEPAVTWIRDGTVISSGKGAALLKFNSLKRTDGGWYLCVANNTADTITNHTVLLVYYPPIIENVTTSSSKSSIGQTVTLKCLSDGVPTPILTWYKPNGMEIRRIRARENKAQVTLREDQDFGDYKCIAANGLSPSDDRIVKITQISGSPYPRLDGKKVAKLLQQDYRMPKPQHVDDELYQIMMRCWQNDPDVRPAFTELRNQLKDMEAKHKFGCLREALQHVTIKVPKDQKFGVNLNISQDGFESLKELIIHRSHVIVDITFPRGLSVFSQSRGEISTSLPDVGGLAVGDIDLTNGSLSVPWFVHVFNVEDSGNLNIEDPTNMFALHFVFLPRLNKALHEYQETFNHHGIRTANSWSPYQMWMNGMLHDDNPLSHGGLDEDPDDLVFYGHYPQGPSPFDDSDNNVTISPIEIHKQDEVLQILQQEIDPLKPSTDMGIDIYIDALDLVNQVLHM